MVILLAARLLGAQHVYNVVVRQLLAITEQGFMPDWAVRQGIRLLLTWRAQEVMMWAASNETTEALAVETCAVNMAGMVHATAMSVQ